MSQHPPFCFQICFYEGALGKDAIDDIQDVTTHKINTVTTTPVTITPFSTTTPVSTTPIVCKCRQAFTCAILSAKAGWPFTDGFCSVATFIFSHEFGDKLQENCDTCWVTVYVLMDQLFRSSFDLFAYVIMMNNEHFTQVSLVKAPLSIFPQ